MVPAGHLNGMPSLLGPDPKMDTQLPFCSGSLASQGWLAAGRAGWASGSQVPPFAIVEILEIDEAGAWSEPAALGHSVAVHCRRFVVRVSFGC